MNLLHSPRPAPSTLLEQAFDRYYPAIFRFFRYRGADVDVANDLAASVFERALLHLNQYDPNRAQIQTWLFAIAHNAAINHWKSEKEETPLDELRLDDELSAQADLPPEEIVIRAQEKEQVLTALQSLDQRSRDILALKFSGELSNREIAALTGLSESNVAVTTYRSLLKLRALLRTPQLFPYKTEVRHGR